MADHPHTTRDTILGTVVGGLALAGLGKLTGVLPQVWDFIARVTRWTAHRAAQEYSLSLPLWVWLMLIAAVVLIPKFVKGRVRSALAKFEAGLVSESRQAPLTQLQTDIMAMFARENGRMLYGPQIASSLNINNLRAGAALDNLVERRFLDTEMNVLYGTGYLVTRAGRDYLLQTGQA